MPTLATPSVFTPAQHLAMLIVTGGLLAAAILIGKLGPERGVRWTLVVSGVLVWLGSGWYFAFHPLEMHLDGPRVGQMKLEESLPIQACDLLALIAPLALVLRCRPVRAIAYFGGIGLTTQAFLTPVIDTGPDTMKFWAFWLLHIVILVSAVFDLTVGRFRPTWKDLCWAVGFWFVYAVAMVILDSRMDWYYGYLGPSIPPNAEGSVLKYLGPWPWRPMVMMGIVLVIFVVLWLPWAVAGRISGRVGGVSPRA